MTRNKDVESFLPMTPAMFHVLIALADGEKHGYAILKEVARRTDLHCVVAGPVEREVCVKLFTDPRMQKAFAMWKKS